MLRTELIRSCSNAAIADVMLRSLGCDFRSRVRDIACLDDQEPGEFAAGLITTFSADADAGDWRRLGDIMAGDDMPLLAGFRYIVEDMIDQSAMQDACAARFDHIHRADAL
ncbi:MAG: hypothetical protein NWT00_04730 [Beijerinckiaceae bacterium]|nr:hypothetical protein [Beijerinckiaceae bacterium]